MFRLIVFVFFIFNSFLFAAQSISSTNQFLNPELDKNIFIERLFGDSLSTSFVIKINDTVQTHKHEFHSETIQVLSGSAILYYNDTVSNIKTGDILFIEKNNWHAVKVTSKSPLTVLSIQSPGFYGKDRIFKD